MLIKDDNEYIKKLFKKYSVGNFQHYIDIKNYDFLKTSSVGSQFYRHKKNPNLIYLSDNNIVNNYLKIKHFNDFYVQLLY